MNDKLEHMSIEQAEMASIFERVCNVPSNTGTSNKGKDKKADSPSNDNNKAAVDARMKSFEDFYNLKVEPPKSELPPIVNIDRSLLYTFDKYRYRYKSGFLSDDSFRREIEQIMTEGMQSTGKYIPINEWQTFTKDGECIIALKYLEYIGTDNNNNSNNNNNTGTGNVDKTKDTIQKEELVKDVLLDSIVPETIITDNK